MTEEMIERFFNKSCTAEEAAQVQAFLREHPEVVDIFLGQNEWDETEPAAMPGSYWEQNWEVIERKTIKRKKIMWLKVGAAAAAVAVGIFFVNYVFFSGVPQKTIPLITAQAEPSQKITINNTTQPMRVILPDSSAVLLSPGALINYSKDFATGGRDISMEGEARFAVIKNKAKPFTVYAGGLATTALGTEFTINTRNTGEEHVTVKLHSGHVVIRATGTLAASWKKDVYLNPGQELRFNTTGLTTAVGPIRKELASLQKGKRRDAIRKAATDSGMTFENAPLDDVMKKLSAYYHQDIIFDSAYLRTMNFTGAISKNDSLPIVLKVITQMNDLEFRHENGHFEIKKPMN